VIRYENYKQFASDVILTFGDAVDPDSEPAPSPER
jgi:hypothetical protein